MVNIKKQVKAYILLESLLGMGLLVTVASLVIGQLSLNRQILEEQLREEEVLSVAIMAVQSELNHLAIDDIAVEVERHAHRLMIYEGRRLVISLEHD